MRGLFLKNAGAYFRHGGVLLCALALTAAIACACASALGSMPGALAASAQQAYDSVYTCDLTVNYSGADVDAVAEAIKGLDGVSGVSSAGGGTLLVFMDSDGAGVYSDEYNSRRAALMAGTEAVCASAAQAELTEAQEESGQKLSALSAQRAQADEALTEAGAELAAATAAQDEAQRALDDAVAALEGIQTDFDAAEAMLVTARAELDAMESDYAQASATLEERVTDVWRPYYRTYKEYNAAVSNGTLYGDARTARMNEISALQAENLDREAALRREVSDALDALEQKRADVASLEERTGAERLEAELAAQREVVDGKQTALDSAAEISETLAAEQKARAEELESAVAAESAAQAELDGLTAPISSAYAPAYDGALGAYVSSAWSTRRFAGASLVAIAAMSAAIAALVQLAVWERMRPLRDMFAGLGMGRGGLGAAAAISGALVWLAGAAVGTVLGWLVSRAADGAFALSPWAAAAAVLPALVCAAAPLAAGSPAVSGILSGISCAGAACTLACGFGTFALVIMHGQSAVSASLPVLALLMTASALPLLIGAASAGVPAAARYVDTAAVYRRLGVPGRTAIRERTPLALGISALGAVLGAAAAWLVGCGAAHALLGAAAAALLGCGFFVFTLASRIEN